MDKLKRCPMCGSEDIHAYSMIVQCARCGLSTSAHKAHSYAVAAWNRRPVEDALLRRIDALEMALEERVWRPRKQFPDNPYCLLCGAGKKWAALHGHQAHCLLAARDRAKGE